MLRLRKAGLWRVLEKENMIQAHKRVKQNGGSAGVDGMSVKR